MRLRTARVAGLLVGVSVVLVTVAVSAFGGTAVQNKAAAQAESARLLTLIQVPPGSVSSATDPTGASNALGQPSYDALTPNHVDAHAWWTTTDSPAAVLSYVGAHLPAGAKLFGWSGGGSPVLSFSDEWALPPIPGVLTQRIIAVTAVTGLTGSLTSVRTDGEAVWLTPRPAWERIPPGVVSVTLTARGSVGNGIKLGPISAPRTTSGWRARRVAAFVNSVEVGQPGTVFAPDPQLAECPVDFPEWVRLRFEAADGKPLATATENPTGCSSISLSIGGRRGPGLDDYPSLTSELLKLGMVPLCDGKKLAPSASLPEPAPLIWSKTRDVDFAFENGSRAFCELHGLPRVTFFDSTGQRLPFKTIHPSGKIVRQENLRADSVVYPGQGGAFSATFRACRGARSAAWARIRLPGIARTFVVPVGSARKPFAPCGGRVSVGYI